MSIKVNRSTSYTPDHHKESKDNEGVVSESYLMGEASTLPLIFLEGEMQKKEFHKPGLSMGPINILEENDPEVIKEYLCGFIDLPAGLLNAGLASDNERATCIDMGNNASYLNSRSESGSWSVSEISVMRPKMVFGNNGGEYVPHTSDGDIYETTMASRVVQRSHYEMDDILDEFSIELEKKMKENGFGSDVVVEDKTSEDTHKDLIIEGEKDTKIEGGVKEPPSIEDAAATLVGRIEDVDFEETLDGIIEIMMELESEERGTDGERAQLREMIREIEEKRSGLSRDEMGSVEHEMELMGIITAVEDKINELKMEKMDNDMENAEVDGALAQIEDKMTELELTQIETEAESSELKRIMDEMEGQLASLEGGDLETEFVKAELEGMMARMEDMMTELEISQLGSDAEKTELERMREELERKLADLDGTKNKDMEDKLQGMEEKMVRMEIQLHDNEDKMHKLKTELEVRRFTLEYIQNLEDKDELIALCSEVGLNCEGSELELRDRLLVYVEGSPQKDSVEDPRFTRNNIEEIETKAELVALCQEAGLKKSGKKEELRQRLLDHIDDLENRAREEKQKQERFTRESIESISTKAELADLCEQAGIRKSGTKDELRERLLEYAIEHEPTIEAPSLVPSIGLGGPDKLVYAVMGDMYKHLSLELGDSVSEYVNDLEEFIRAILDIRKELNLDTHEVLKSVVIRPQRGKTGELLNKLRNPFLDKVKAENLEVVEPGKEWDGIKLNMDMNKELISASFKSQSTKIQMLLRLQPPSKIRKIMEEKGEYTLGVEGYPVTISPKMLSFNEITPENFEIRNIDCGTLYIEKEVVERVEERELPPPPPDYVEEPAPPEEKVQEEVEGPQIKKDKIQGPQKTKTKKPRPSDPQEPKKKRTNKKKGFIGKLRSRLKKSNGK